MDRAALVLAQVQVELDQVQALLVPVQDRLALVPEAQVALAVMMYPQFPKVEAVPVAQVMALAVHLKMSRAP